jgi:hypothetical protein
MKYIFLTSLVLVSSYQIFGSQVEIKRIKDLAEALDACNKKFVQKLNPTEKELEKARDLLARKQQAEQAAKDAAKKYMSAAELNKRLKPKTIKDLAGQKNSTNEQATRITKYYRRKTVYPSA